MNMFLLLPGHFGVEKPCPILPVVLVYWPDYLAAASDESEVIKCSQ